MRKGLWKSFVHPLSGYFRRRRWKLLLESDPGFLHRKIIDVGGSIHFWEKIGVDLDQCDITIINKTADAQSAGTRRESDQNRILIYDGERIPFAEGEFDWVICNSVIEHVPLTARAGFSEELMRVGKRFMVQTPAYAFPIEPHLVTPFLHWAPRRARYFLARFGLWSLLYRRTATEIADYVDEVALLRRADLRRLFPEAVIHVERLFWIPKSYVAIGYGRR